MSPSFDDALRSPRSYLIPMPTRLRHAFRTEPTSACRSRGTAGVAAILALLLILSVAACGDRPTAPERLTQGREAVLLDGWWMYGATEVQARPMWRFQYRSAAAFLDREGRIDRVRWFLADSILGRTGVYRATGVWLEPHTIVIARGFAGTPTTVCHESVHELLQTAGHRHVAFERCPFGS